MNRDRQTNILEWCVGVATIIGCLFSVVMGVYDMKQSIKTDSLVDSITIDNVFPDDTISIKEVLKPHGEKQPYNNDSIRYVHKDSAKDLPLIKHLLIQEKYMGISDYDILRENIAKKEDKFRCKHSLDNYD